MNIDVGRRDDVIAAYHHVLQYWWQRALEVENEVKQLQKERQDLVDIIDNLRRDLADMTHA